MKGLPLLLAAATLLPACGGTAFPAFRTVQDPERRAALLSFLSPPPAGPRILRMKAVLGRAGEEESLNLHAVLFPSRSICLAASSDLGRDVFAVGLRGGGTIAGKDHPRYPLRLLDGFLRDLDLAYLPPPPDSFELVELAGGEPALLAREGGREALFGDRCGRIEHGEGGRLLSVLRVEEWAIDEEGKRILPRRLSWEEAGSRSRARLEVAAWKTADLREDEVFENLRRLGESR
jgi:hypothetical protein